MSDVLESLALLMRDAEGESMPNFEGTDEGHGAAGKRAALEMPFESKEAGIGASRTDNPLPLAGEKAKPPSRGEP